MKILLLKLVLLFTPFVAVACYLEYKLRRIPNVIVQSRQNMEQALPNIEVLINGDSHTVHGINTHLLDQNAFNLSYPGQDIHYITQFILKYLPQATKLKLVIINISYFTLENDLCETGSGNEQCNFYRKFYDLPQSLTERFAPYNYSYISLYDLWAVRVLARNNFRDDSHQLPWYEDPSLSIDQKGQIARIGKTYRLGSDEGKERAALHKTWMKPQNIDRNVNSLETLINALQARNVSVVFITTPCYSSYYEALDPEAYQRMQDVIKRLCQKHNLEYYNYIKDSRFTTDDFSDIDHFNEKGEAKFTQIIKDEFIEKYFTAATKDCMFYEFFPINCYES